MTRHLFLSAALPLLLAPLAPLTAQTNNHLVALTRQVPTLRHLDHSACLPLGLCVPPGFPNAVGLPAWAGGTAWDPTTSGAWITNGQMLAKVDDNCAYQCPPLPIPFTTLNAVATGLEVVESQRRLFLIDSLGFLHQYSLTCPPQQLSICQTGLVPIGQQVTSGLAVDEGLGYVFFSYPDFATNVNWIVVSTLANPCQPIQRIPVQACPQQPVPFQALTGLAVDWGRRVIYGTDGMSTIALHYLPMAIPGIAIQGQSCCTIPTPNLDPMIGLAVRPGRETTMGNGCANGACPSCPMTHGLVNDPNLGNGMFRLDLQNAPAGSLAWDILGSGPCAAPGVGHPFLCGPIFVPLLLGTIGPIPTGGFGGCSGSAVFHLPLPVIPSLIGEVISSQCSVLCAATSGSLGTSLSNCVSFRLQGN